MFVTRKKYERKKRKIEEQVMHQQSATTESSALPISIPRKVFTAAHVTNALQLNSRLKVAFELPTNWVNMTSSLSEASNIRLCCLTQCPPLQHIEVKYTIHIDQLLMWTLSF